MSFIDMNEKKISLSIRDKENNKYNTKSLYINSYDKKNKKFYLDKNIYSNIFSKDNVEEDYKKIEGNKKNDIKEINKLNDKKEEEFTKFLKKLEREKDTLREYLRQKIELEDEIEKNKRKKYLIFVDIYIYDLENYKKFINENNNKQNINNSDFLLLFLKIKYRNYFSIFYGNEETLEDYKKIFETKNSDLKKNFESFYKSIINDDSIDKNFLYDKIPFYEYKNGDNKIDTSSVLNFIKKKKNNDKYGLTAFFFYSIIDINELNNIDFKDKQKKYIMESNATIGNKTKELSDIYYYNDIAYDIQLYFSYINAFYINDDDKFVKNIENFENIDVYKKDWCETQDLYDGTIIYLHDTFFDTIKKMPLFINRKKNK